MTNLIGHEKMSKTALSFTGWLRVLREDVASLNERMLTAELSAFEAAELAGITDGLAEDVAFLSTQLRDARDQKPIVLTETTHGTASAEQGEKE